MRRLIRRTSRLDLVHSKGVYPHRGCFLSLTAFSLSFPMLSDPEAIRIQTTVFFCFHLPRPQDRNCGRKC